MKPEILAPVGGDEQLIAAVRSGADAVYLGTKNMNARRNASNFDAEELKKAVAYSHAHNVKVYVTLNTLLFDDELPLLLDELKSVCEAGADAFIVQDLAVAKLAKETCPEIALHGSTQMSVHNVWGVQALKEMGFERVVLARELSLEEIKTIKKSVPDMQLEVFVHGALCMSVSGMCYLSAMIGERSGNRGLCAQPCRLDFKCKNRDYALSLKDMSYISRIEELEKIGVDSFKIEGRMKRPEYVAAAVDACQKAINKEYADVETLKAVFSRSGFTDGYLTGKRSLNMFGHRTKEDVQAASGVLKKLSNLYKSERPSVKADMKLILSTESSVLEVSALGKNVSFSEDAAVYEPEHALSLDKVNMLLSKTGGTAFLPGEIEFEAFDGAMLPYSTLNKMRREALSKLYDKLESPQPKKFVQVKMPKYNKRLQNETLLLRGRFAHAAQVCCGDIFDKIILPIEEILKNKNVVEKFGNKLIAELPALVFPEYCEKVKKNIDDLKSIGVSDVACDNIGLLEYCKNLDFRLHGNFGLNITNSVSLTEYAERFKPEDAVVSFEMPMSKIAKLEAPLPIGVVGYGYLPLMRFRACPFRDEKGCGSCKGGGVISDRLNNSFELICEKRRYSTLLNSVPLCISDKDIKTDFVLLYFNNENESEIKNIVRLFKNKCAPDFKRTNGLYFRKLK